MLISVFESEESVCVFCCGINSKWEWLYYNQLHLLIHNVLAPSCVLTHKQTATYSKTSAFLLGAFSLRPIGIKPVVQLKVCYMYSEGRPLLSHDKLTDSFHNDSKMAVLCLCCLWSYYGVLHCGYQQHHVPIRDEFVG
jgi:hypothetical protein